MARPHGKRNEVLAELGALRAERSSWDSTNQDLVDYFRPWSGRFTPEDRNRGDRERPFLYDTTGPRAATTLTSGLMATTTNPTKDWFRYGAADPDLDKNPIARTWFDFATKLGQFVLQKSNSYLALRGLYDELVVIGTGANIVLPHGERVLHHYPVTCGEYFIAQNDEGDVDTLFREFQMSVGSIVRQFGLEACSRRVQRLYDECRYHDWVTVVQAIRPRRERDESRSHDNLHMPWESVYIESADDDKDPNRVLRESGYRRFPAMVPRWEVSGSDVYGHGLGWYALPDCQGLQHKHFRLGQNIDFGTKPPLQGPTSLAGREVEMVPGGFTPVDSPAAAGGVRPIWQVQQDIAGMTGLIGDQRLQLRQTFFADLFRMFSDSVDQQKTAYEASRLYQEQLVMLGPVTTRLERDVQGPLALTVFERMLETGMLPPPPPELDGAEINVEFVGMLAQAQRAAGVAQIQQFVGELTVVGQTFPDVRDKFNVDAWADRYSQMLGVPGEFIVAGRDLALVRKKKAEALAAKEQAETMAMQAKAARDLGAVATGAAPQNNMATDVLSRFTGY